MDKFIDLIIDVLTANMKYLFILFVLTCFITGCGEDTHAPGVREYYGNRLGSYVDSKNKVICYVLYGYESISCVKLEDKCERH